MLYSPVGEDTMVERSSLPAWKGLALIFLPALVVFILVDGVFIALVAGPMFQAALQDALRPSPDLLAGLLAWVCIVGLIYCYALPRSSSTQEAFLQGAGAGLCLYGTYELTNMSILQNWTWTIVASDMAWGSLACGVSCVTMWLIQGKLVGRR